LDDQIIAIHEWAKGILSTNCLMSILDVIAKLFDINNFTLAQGIFCFRILGNGHFHISSFAGKLLLAMPVT
jgi:hypothetical protein